MKRPDPKVDGRRTDVVFAELLARAQAWIPHWQLLGNEAKDQDPDFGRALLHIAARISSEVTERLDRTPGKMALGLLDWLGIARRSGHAARMPVIFKMAEGAADPALAPKRTRLQANAGDTPVSFETVDDVQLVPSPISQMIGVDPDKDAIYFPPADVLSLEPPTLGPTEWAAKSLASAKDFTLQLTPPLGLNKDMLLEVAKLEYRVSADLQGDLVTVEPAIGTANLGSLETEAGVGKAIEAGAAVKKVGEFIPFGGVSRNLQEHALYIGDDDVLKLNSPQPITIQGGASLLDGTDWEYWGKLGDADPKWNPFNATRTQNGDLQLEFRVEAPRLSVSIEGQEIKGRKSHWIRARRAAGNGSSLTFAGLRLKINCGPQAEACNTPESPAKCCRKFDDIPLEGMPKMEGVANNISLVLNERFYPLGKIPRQLDSFYLACAEVFSKTGAEVCVRFEMTDPTLKALAVVEAKSWYVVNRSEGWTHFYHVYGVGKDGFLHRYLLHVGETPRKPFLKYVGSTRPPSQTFTAADHEQAPVVIDRPNSIRVVVWSKNMCWVWEQKGTEQNADKNWSDPDFGVIGYGPKSDITISHMVLVGSKTLVATANDGSIWFRGTEAGSWNPLGLLVGCGDIYDVTDFVDKLKNDPASSTKPVSDFIWAQFLTAIQQLLENPASVNRESILAGALNNIIEDKPLYDVERFSKIALRTQTQELVNEHPTGNLLVKLNRLLLEDAYPSQIRKSEQWNSVVPIMKQSLSSVQPRFAVTESLDDVFFAVRKDNKDNQVSLSRFVFSAGTWTSFENMDFSGNRWDSGFSPFSVFVDEKLLFVSKSSKNEETDIIGGKFWTAIQQIKLYGAESIMSASPQDISKEVEKLVGSSICGAIREPLPNVPFYKELYLFFTVSRQNGQVLAWWTPFDADAAHNLFYDDNPPPRTIGILEQSPGVANSLALVPGESRDVLVGNIVPLRRKQIEFASVDLVDRLKSQADIQDGGFVEFQTQVLKLDSASDNYEKNRLGDQTFLYDFPGIPLPSGNINYFAPPAGNTFQAVWKNTAKPKLIYLNNPPVDQDGNSLIAAGQFLLLEYPADGTGTLTIKYCVLEVASYDKTTSEVKVKSAIPSDAKDNVDFDYHLYASQAGSSGGLPQPKAAFDSVVRPVIKLANSEMRDIPTGTVLHFLDTRTKPKQQAISEIIDTSTPPLAVLTDPWDVRPGSVTGQYHIEIDDSHSDWARYTADVETKPDISWEYWNGSGWWKIEKVDDGTENLKQSGALWFEVPSDIQQTEVLGRKSWWIRGRLFSGDYGREAFDVTTTTTTPPTGNAQTQSVVINTDNVHAPLALGIRIDYSLCKPIFPRYLLTSDSMTLLDQSDANRTPGATVEAFVPVADRLGRMMGPAAGSALQNTSEDMACGCASLMQAPPTATVPCPMESAVMAEPANTGTSPRVLSRIPAPGAAEVAVDRPIQAVFSLPMDPATINDRVFELRDANDQPVPGTVDYVDSSRIAIFKPLAALTPSASYRVTIGGGSQVTQAKAQNGNPLASDVTWTFSTAATSTRAIYLAFDKPLSGGPIRILFLLEGRDHDTAAPLVVETLRNNRFEPVVANDDTRALGETGLVTLSLDGPPSQAELFGKTGYWLRLRPATAASAAAWSPVIRGAYVNAVQAEATESQVLEILGSSDGSPAQTFTLLRPPVLQDSLELRVLEPLGDEEKAALSKTPGTVVENVPGLTAGRWVLWREVVDPGDLGPDDRVYALDPVSGEIRFGDGKHGMIPPIGTDAIVAFAYRRGGEAAANRVPPFVPINIVTPIAGAESVITPDHVAGGSDAEETESVQRFAAPRLRHRDRAVTLRDLEDLALHFSPEIVQARAFNDKNGLRLVVVIGARGNPATVVRPANPDPSRAQARVLRDYLLQYASPVLARQGNLSVVAAVRVNFRVELRLGVASVDVTGSVGNAVKTAVETLFDPGMGGWDGLGWPIGAVPAEDEVAARLVGIGGLDTVESVVFVPDDGAGRPANRNLTVAADQLAWLVPEGVKLYFTARQVMS